MGRITRLAIALHLLKLLDPYIAKQMSGCETSNDNKSLYLRAFHFENCSIDYLSTFCNALKDSKVNVLHFRYTKLDVWDSAHATTFASGFKDSKVTRLNLTDNKLEEWNNSHWLPLTNAISKNPGIVIDGLPNNTPAKLKGASASNKALKDTCKKLQNFSIVVGELEDVFDERCNFVAEEALSAFTNW